MTLCDVHADHPIRIGGTISLTIPKLKNMEEQIFCQTFAFLLKMIFSFATRSNYQRVSSIFSRPRMHYSNHPPPSFLFIPCFVHMFLFFLLLFLGNCLMSQERRYKSWNEVRPLDSHYSSTRTIDSSQSVISCLMQSRDLKKNMPNLYHLNAFGKVSGYCWP